MPFFPETTDAIACGCGLGTVCYCGPDPVGALGGGMLAKGFDVYAFTGDPEQAALAESYFPGRCITASLEDALDGRHADILVIDALLDALSLEEVTGILPKLGRCARYVVLLSTVVKTGNARRNREWMEARCIEAGMRRHPRGQQITPYWKLNEDPEVFILLMERIPETALVPELEID